MTAPVRIQLSRRARFSLQATSRAINGREAVSVARPTRWGNPYKAGDTVHRGPSFSGRDEVVRDAAHAVELYRRWLFTQARSENLLPLLRGKNLACWCKPGDPCHADVLLEMANRDV
jgi:hypothetical protein